MSEQSNMQCGLQVGERMLKSQRHAKALIFFSKWINTVICKKQMLLAFLKRAF